MPISTMKSVQQDQYKFVPQDDITPLEAVWIAHFLDIYRHAWDFTKFEQWELIKRHFQLIEKQEID